MFPVYTIDPIDQIHPIDRIHSIRRIHRCISNFFSIPYPDKNQQRNRRELMAHRHFLIITLETIIFLFPGSVSDSKTLTNLMQHLGGCRYYSLFFCLSFLEKLRFCSLTIYCVEHFRQVVWRVDFQKMCQIVVQQSWTLITKHKTRASPNVICVNVFS